MCVQKLDGKIVTFLVLYVDDILLIGNDVGVLSSIKVWLPIQFCMKNLGEASYVLGNKLLCDCQNRIVSQASTIDQVLAR